MTKKNKLQNKRIIAITLLVLIVSIIVYFIIEINKNSGVGEDDISRNQKINIGYSGTLSGKYAYVGNPLKNGFVDAFSEINDSIAGYEINVITEDNKGIAKEAVSNYYFFKEHDVNVVIAAFNHISEAIAPIANRQETIFISNSMNPDLPKNNDYVFRMYSDAQIEAKRLSSIIPRNKKTALVYLDISIGYLFANEIKNNMEGMSFVDFKVAADDMDFKTIVLKMKEEKIENVIIFVYNHQAVAFFKQCYETNFNPKYIIASSGGKRENVDGFNEYLEEDNTKYVTSWYFDGNINFDYFTGYSTGKILIVAMEECAKKGIKPDDTECLRDELKRVEYEKWFNVDEYGNIAVSPDLYTIKDENLVLME